MGEEVKNKTQPSQEVYASQNKETTKQPEVNNQSQQIQVVNTQIKKGLRIANIIFLCILIAAEIFALIYYIPGVQALLAKDLSALAIIAILPLYILITLGIFVISIIMTIISKAWKKYLIRMQQSPNFLDKLMGFIGWIIVAINILGFAVLYII